jgi:hypothetical protein
MQVFTSLAYGFTGIAYFTYDVAFERGLIEKDGSPNRLFEDARIVNQEVAVLGRALRYLKSAGIWHISGQTAAGGKHETAAIPDGLRAFDAEAVRASQIKEIRLGKQTLPAGALIGVLNDGEGGVYLMPVNLQQAANMSSTQLQLELTLKFDDSVKEVYRLARDTGRVERLEVRDGALELSLPGGTGDLIKIGDGRFPGIDG